MLRLEKHPKLIALGYRLVLQVHDEFVLEGPQEHVHEASAIVLLAFRAEKQRRHDGIVPK